MYTFFSHAKTIKKYTVHFHDTFHKRFVNECDICKLHGIQRMRVQSLRTISVCRIQTREHRVL